MSMITLFLRTAQVENVEAHSHVSRDGYKVQTLSFLIDGCDVTLHNMDKEAIRCFAAAIADAAEGLPDETLDDALAAGRHDAPTAIGGIDLSAEIAAGVRE